LEISAIKKKKIHKIKRKDNDQISECRGSRLETTCSIIQENSCKNDLEKQDSILNDYNNLNDYFNENEQIKHFIDTVY